MPRQGRKEKSRARGDRRPIVVEFSPEELAYMRKKADTIGIRALTEYIRMKCLEDRELETTTKKVLEWLKAKPGAGA